MSTVEQQLEAQAAKIASLESSLSDVQQQNILLKAAIAHFEARITTLEQQAKSSPNLTPRHVKRNSLTKDDLVRPSSATASPAGSRSASTKGKPPRPTTADPKKHATPSGIPTPTKDTKEKPEKNGITTPAKSKPVLSSSTPEHKSAAHSANAEVYNVGKHNIYVERPTKYKSLTPSDAPPKQHLELEYAYGYNGSYRGNLAYTSDGHIVYTLAGTGIVSDLKTNEQKFMTEHNEDIVSLAIHPNKKIVATGQRDPKGAGTPFILIWDTTTQQVISRIVHHERGIIALTFSTDGSKLISIGDDDSHSGAIWNWEDKLKPVAEGKQHEPLITFITAKDVVFGARAVMMNDDDKNPSEFSWVTYGAKHLKIWHAKQNGGKWETSSRIPMTLEITKVVQKAYHHITPVPGGGFVAGTADGHIYVFDPLGKLASHHKITTSTSDQCAVSALTVDEKGRLIVATYQGQIHIFNSHQGIKDKDRDTNVISIYPNAQPRSIDYNASSNTLLIGTKNGEIIQTSLEWKTSKIMMKGHTDEIWGLAMHPTAQHVAVGAHDKILRIWDYSTRQFLIQVGLGHGIRSIAYSFDGNLLAVGHRDGFITVLDTSDIRPGVEYNDSMLFFQKKIHTEQVDAISFTPNGSLLVAGSYDQTISVHEIRSAKGGETRPAPRPMSASKKGKPESKEKEKEDKSKWILTQTKSMKGHTSSISHLMVSADSKYLATNSRDYEILYWDLEKGARVTSGGVDPDLKWTSWQNLLGWPVQGIWGEAGDGTDVNSVTISGTDETPDAQRVIATGDDHGQVNLFAYPALHKKAQPYVANGHSAHVTQVRFTPDQQHLFSCGGGDLGVFQWKFVQ